VAEARAADGPDPTPPRDAGTADVELSTLTSAWADLLGNLPQRPKVRFAGGRWLSVTDGIATFGLPNPVHAQRCEECRGDVEAALTAHFGRPVSVLVVVDGDAEAPAEHGAPRPQTAEADEDVDVHDLTDAEDVAETGVERVAAVFPGAQVIDPPPDRLL
jgi:hypothetical protein